MSKSLLSSTSQGQNRCFVSKTPTRCLLYLILSLILFLPSNAMSSQPNMVPILMLLLEDDGNADQPETDNAVPGGREVQLAWNLNSETNLAGYKVYHGTTSRHYENSIDVGRRTAAKLTGLPLNKDVYMAVTAYDSYGHESPFSLELVLRK